MLSSAARLERLCIHPPVDKLANQEKRYGQGSNAKQQGEEEAEGGMEQEEACS
jgi:hypothetical protein